jgi:hypothetical protein
VQCTCFAATASSLHRTFEVKCVIVQEHDKKHRSSPNIKLKAYSLARYGPSFALEYLSRVSMVKHTTHSPVMAAAAPKYRKAAGATSAAVRCPPSPLLLAFSWASSDSVDVAQPERPAPTTKPWQGRCTNAQQQQQQWKLL